MNKQLIEIDGASGEGGGQILRSALTLAMITGQAFQIKNIRAKRPKPGLLRQHLTAVEAAAAICGAQMTGAQIGSTSLSFKPGAIRAGDYHFAIGTAGSCTLVLQTILPALWFADAPSSVSVKGGTHNKAAPPADFLIRVWQPLMARMGVQQEITLKRHGFYPAGGGEICATVSPCPSLQGFDLCQRGALRSISATALIAGVPAKVAQRELAEIEQKIAGVSTAVRGLSNDQGPGNAVLIEIEHENITEMFTSFGEKGVSAEAVGKQVAHQVQRYLHSGAAVDEFLADQLVLAFALAGSGRFTTTHASAHLLSNIDVIRQFLPVNITQTQVEGGVEIVVS
ncbi:RNA 3'-terminal phosphate cyclase [Chitinibacter sp. GC72]|uniref:RNA 3'-terminal phosphate cyclase n=1 Tax=Chitinibacter sp. GC72 TaxID=1526917 RepID=UPI0012FA483F|nr:RNA 3'-terminal phosphate cyclase [Chitinibacter sp. GC72]